MGAHVSEQLLNQMAEKIVDAIHPLQIYLFGSHARGAANVDSDVDLLIVTHENYGPNNSRRKVMSKIWRLLADIPVAKDIVLFSQIEVEHWRTAQNHVVARALHEGRLLYERR